MAISKPESLPFKDYKAALLDYDFAYFFSKEAKENGYSDKDLQDFHIKYEEALNRLQSEQHKNRKQFRLYLEGIVHLQFSGGLLPSLFKMDGWTVDQYTLDFKSLGEDWAYFETWQKLERKYQHKNKIWSLVVKLGAILAYVLTLIKITEFF